MTGNTGQTFLNKQTSSKHRTNMMDRMMDVVKIKKKVSVKKKKKT